MSEDLALPVVALIISCIALFVAVLVAFLT